MTDKKQAIQPEDIEVRDVKRRKFVMGATGAIAATGLISLSSCGGGGRKSNACNSDVGDPIVADADPTDPVTADADLGDPCDTD